MTALHRHCNRCGRPSESLLPDAPPPGTDGLSLAVDMDGPWASVPFLVCEDCHGDTEKPYRYCARCGQETPPEELRGGHCAWCLAAESIPFEEPDDEAWWAGRTPS